jgi:hypothetical protein
MKPLAFLFALLLRFVPMETVESETMKADAQAWWDAIKPGDSPDLLVKLKEHGSTWYVRAGLAALFIFATRWIYDYLNPVDGEEEEEED